MEGVQGAEEQEKKGLVNKINSAYMLNMKAHHMDAGKPENRQPSSIMSKKVSKNNPSKLKSRHQQGKRNQVK